MNLTVVSIGEESRLSNNSRINPKRAKQISEEHNEFNLAQLPQK